MRPKSKPLAWWIWPGILTGSLAALTALGSLAVNYASFAALPTKVKQVEAKNDDQDTAIDKLTAIQQTWTEIYQQQQQRPSPPAPPRPATIPRAMGNEKGTRKERGSNEDPKAVRGLNWYEAGVGWWHCPHADWVQCNEEFAWERIPGPGRTIAP